MHIALSSRIPNLQFDGFAFKFNCSDFKTDANGANVAVNIRVIGESGKQARFSNGGVTDNKKLKQVIAFVAHDVFFHHVL